ncbi:hypothetical protein DXX93_19230 [Thalassotalea euphylliae]|uniref:GlyGly-CTERM sorting domain-containing protein n=1 Tax=Thalassotalea euphylliae TaxID=1655234 RepID=A0A3E0TV71_9GAMM|nr:hypothetical protein [Thalassotalea euphylliae]REL28488.1 hypothetical protein DXX93_19230 [Thalassotalea euphylliae]
MLKKQKLGLAFLFSFLTFSQHVSASLIQGWGVQANAGSASNCSAGSCTSANGGRFAGENDGGEHQTTATLEHDLYGYGRAYADLSGSGYLPTLKVFASSEFGSRGTANAFGVQRFTYEGADNHTIDLDYNLHGSITEFSSRNYLQLRADVGVLIGDSLEWYPDFASLYFEFGGDLEPGGNDSEFISSGADVNMPGRLSFDIDNGQSFYVITSVSARAYGGEADGWNTLSLSFLDTSGLTAASAGSLNNQSTTAVPLPATWLMLLLPLAMLVRRQK